MDQIVLTNDMPAKFSVTGSIRLSYWEVVPHLAIGC